MTYTLTYELTNNGTEYSVTGHTGEHPTDVVIPKEYNALPVTSIGSSAFMYCRKLTSVTIPDSVTSIGENAFEYCSSLTGVEIPDSVTSIGKGAFSRCTSLTNITIPFVGASKDGTTDTHFGYIFGANSSSENLSSLPPSLKTVVITGGTSIGDRAFKYCSSLMSITIPDSVTSIGKYAFERCSSLTSIEIPDSVTSINYAAFDGCSSLASVVIGDSVTSISDYAFKGCSSLASIEIPDSVTSIGFVAFKDCSKLASVVIGESVTSIGARAFEGCSSLKNIVLLSNTPASLGTSVFNSISTDAKFYCYSSSLHLYKTATNWNIYADKFVADDLRLYFTMSARAQKKYFASKKELHDLQLVLVTKKYVETLEERIAALEAAIANVATAE